MSNPGTFPPQGKALRDVIDAEVRRHGWTHFGSYQEQVKPDKHGVRCTQVTATFGSDAHDIKAELEVTHHPGDRDIFDMFHPGSINLKVHRARGSHFNVSGDVMWTPWQALDQITEGLTEKLGRRSRFGWTPRVESDVTFMVNNKGWSTTSIVTDDTPRRPHVLVCGYGRSLHAPDTLIAAVFQFELPESLKLPNPEVFEYDHLHATFWDHNQPTHAVIVKNASPTPDDILLQLQAGEAAAARANQVRLDRQALRALMRQRQENTQW